MNKRKKSNYQANGRSHHKTEQYTRIPHKVVTHENFRRLNGSSVKVLFEICSRCNGYNNGQISASYGELATLLKIGKQTVSNALEELQIAGFIVMSRKGFFTGRKASEWEVTFLEKSGLPASNIWAQQKTIRACRRKNPKPKGDLLADIAKEASMMRQLEKYPDLPDRSIG